MPFILAIVDERGFLGSLIGNEVIGGI